MKNNNKLNIHSLEHYAKQNKVKTRSDKFKKAMDLASLYGAIDSEVNNYQHRCHVHIRDEFFPPVAKKNIVMFQSIVYLNDIIKKMEDEKKERNENDWRDRNEQKKKQKKKRQNKKKSPLHQCLFDIDCGVLEKQENNTYKHRDELLGLNIKIAMSQKKTIFIMFCFADYGINEAEDCDKEYMAHTSSMVLVPFPDSYKAYYINSHGSDMKNTDFYDIILTRTRAKHIQYDKPLDIVFIEKYIEFINQWNFISSQSDFQIKFENTDEFVYYGADLQGGDYEGICFVYPMIIWYYFGKYFHATREIKTKKGVLKLSKGITLLKQKKLSLFIESMFIDFNEKYYNLVAMDLLEKNEITSKNLNVLIEKEEKIFTTSLIDIYMGFITQKAMVNKIQSYFDIDYWY